MAYLFLSTTLNLLIIFLGCTAGFLFTPESADFSDKSLIHYVKNGSAPAGGFALANMSRQFKMKTNSGSKSCFLKIQHIDQVCNNLSELELVVSYETDCHFFSEGSGGIDMIKLSAIKNLSIEVMATQISDEDILHIKDTSVRFLEYNNIPTVLSPSGVIVTLNLNRRSIKI